MTKCRTFDVNDTGRISESKFRQILATKQVPKDDVEGILQGVEMKKQNIMFWDIEDDIPNDEGLIYAISDDLFCFAEYRKLEVVPGDTNSVDGSEEQILYKGFSPILFCKYSKIFFESVRTSEFPELIRMLQAPPPAEGWT